MSAIANTGFTATDVLSRLDGFILHYSKWKVGLTDNPFLRRTQIGTPDGWRFWPMSGESESQAAVRILLRQGMSECDLSGGARYLYIFPAEADLYLKGELVVEFKKALSV